MSEHEEQVMLFAWADLLSAQYPELGYMFAVPNGAKLPWHRARSGKRYSVEAMRLKREGLKPGVPDIFLPAPRRSYHGLFVEMKVGRNPLSEAQRKYAEYLTAQGYLTVTCYGLEAAQEVILWYLSERKE